MSNEELYQQLKDLNQAMGEAGGIAFCELWGVSTDEDGVKHPVKINVTARDLNSASALRQLMTTIKIAKEEYHLKPYLSTSGSVSKPATAAVNASTGRPEKSTEGAQVFNCNKLVVSQYNGKAKLDFYATGRRYAELTSYVTPEQAGAWFQPFGLTSQNFTGSGEFAVNVNVTWVNSDKLNSKGNPYKNVLKIDGAQ